MSDYANSYRELLNREYSVRKSKNPSYSLRSFSRDCGLSPSHMSDVLADRYGLSSAKAREIARGLKFDQRDTELFLLLVECAHGRSAIARETAKEKLSTLQAKPDIKVSEQVFAMLSNWYHFAILELMKTLQFDSDPSWIAAALDITAEEAESALQRLTDLNLIKSCDGKLVPVQEFTASPEGIPSAAIRQYHRQLLARATDALETQDFHDRDFSTMNFVIEKSKLPKLKDQIRDFRRRIVKEFAADQGGSEVYCYSSQLFRLNKTDI